MLRSSGHNVTLKIQTPNPNQRKSGREAHKTYSDAKLSVAGRAVLCSIQERKTTVVDVSIQAMIAKKRGERGEETT